MRFIATKIISAVILFGMAAFLLTRYGSANAASQRAEKAVVGAAPDLTADLNAKNLTYGSPIFLRIVKSNPTLPRPNPNIPGTNNPDPNDKGYLEAFVQNADGEFQFFRRWDICTWSGTLGPKLKEGDGQSPEGFYFVIPSSLNPNSSYHLSFNLGYPNAYDRAHKRTGSFLMVHGKCVSIGCYAMTDEGIDDIYTLLSAAFDGGQPFVRVHIFPFPMTNENIAAHNDHKEIVFWKNLKQGWDHFERRKQPPNVTVSGKRYIFARP